MTTTVVPMGEVVDEATRREFLALIAAAGLIASCGDESPSAPSGVEKRTVDGAYGPIEIPVDPKRVFADLMTVDYLTALGFDTSRIVGVFGATFFRDDETHYLAEFFAREDVIDPGFVFEANVEAVAAVEPDLILLPFDQIDGAEQFDELAEIAPLLVVSTSDTRDPAIRYGGSASFQDWRTTLRAYGALLGLNERAETYIAETDEQLATLAETHGDLIAAITATEAKSTTDFVAINALNTARKSGVLGTILMSELGFQPPRQQAEVTPDDYGTIELSAENINLVDGDLLFLEVREGSTRHEQSPLWARLRVVQSGGVVVVGNHWEFGGAVAAREVIADIGAALDQLAAGRG